MKQELQIQRSHQHRQRVGRIIFSGFLEKPLKKFVKDIGELERSHWFKKYAVISYYFSPPPHTTGFQESEIKNNVIASVLKEKNNLSIRFSWHGFNKKYIVHSGLSLVHQDAGGSRYYHLMRKINFRNELTLLILKEIIRRQEKSFFSNHPMDRVSLSQSRMVEQMKNMNIRIEKTWVCRLVNRLAIRTPVGDLKYLRSFFIHPREMGKMYLQDILERELDKIVSGKINKPYSDETLSGILKSVYNFSCSRRNVAYCREEIGVSSSKNRYRASHYPPEGLRFFDPVPVSGSIEKIRVEPGIYELRLQKGMINYPGGASPVFYIGSSKNLRKRISAHLGGKKQNNLIRNFLDKKPCSIRTASVEKDWRDAEKKLYNRFIHTYGATPVCNRMSP